MDTLPREGDAHPEFFAEHLLCSPQTREITIYDPWPKKDFTTTYQ